jgi:hypothetical protein
MPEMELLPKGPPLGAGASEEPEDEVQADVMMLQGHKSNLIAVLSDKTMLVYS